MYLNGNYVGLGIDPRTGVADRSPEIAKLKALLKRKFGPARATLDDSPLYTLALRDEVTRVQKVYISEGVVKHPGAPKYLLGVVNLEFKYDVGLLTRPAKPRPIIFTQEGHQSNMWVGPCATVAGKLEQEGVCHWKPIGDWNTTALPFDKSGVDAWRRWLSREQIEGPPIDPANPDGPKVMWPFPRNHPWGGVAFSRGAKDFCDFMERYVIPPGAELNWRLDGFKRGLAFGNPRRGRNKIAPWALSPPSPNTHGIMDKLFDADALGIGDRWAENANDNDMFAEIGDDKAGRNQTAIAKIITENSWFGGPSAVAARALAILGNPIGEIGGVALASIDAIMFLASNPNPHYATFATGGDIEWMRGVAA